MKDVNIDHLNGLAIEAGEIIMGIYNSMDENFEIDRKADDTPLTEADLRANTHICTGLRNAYPDIPIISEENRQKPYAMRKKWSSAWLVDPLDGTKEFIKKNGEFTVNIALIVNGIPIIGVLYAPALEELYYAKKGEGASMRKGGKCHTIKAASFQTTDEGLSFVASRSHMNTVTNTFIKQFRDPHIVSSGSSLKFMLLARGEAHIYPRIAPTMEWDTAAADAILREAGGQVLQYESLTPLKYNKEDLLNPHFVAIGAIKDPESLSKINNK